VWHKTADEIVDSLVTYCQRTNASGHEAKARGHVPEFGKSVPSTTLVRITASANEVSRRHDGTGAGDVETGRNSTASRRGPGWVAMMVAAGRPERPVLLRYLLPGRAEAPSACLR
jgi:hypothetical protein